MSKSDAALLQKIEYLIHTVQALADKARAEQDREQARYTLKCMAALGDAVLKERDVFGIEPWHGVHDDVPLAQPGEYLLRLKDGKGEALPPYPAIMCFYEHGMTAAIDTALFLCALAQFSRSEEKQVSINVSARSLRDADFIRTVLARLNDMSFAEDEKIIIEIHETTPDLKMSKDVLRLLREAGVMFAIDDVGLSMDDVLRMAEFDEIADFVKLDRHSVCAHPENKNSLDHVISFVTSMLPDAVLVAEGVKSAEHAAQLLEHHPQIKYVQGLYLPTSRSEFSREWAAQRGDKAA